MILVVGKMNLGPVIDSLVLMAKDDTKSHELNKERGRGSWVHPDGWGIAYLQNGKFIIKKSVKPIWEDPEVENLKELNTTLAVLHVRRKTMGTPHIENTHPFIVSNEEEFVFCHNGTVEDEIPFSSNFEPTGSTDSERLFYSIMTDIKQHATPHFITNKIKAFTISSGSNVVLVNKEKSVVGVNYNRYNNYYTMSLAKLPEGIVVSSEELPYLPDAKWTKVDDSMMVTINNDSQEYNIEKVNGPILEQQSPLP
jgi:predicted glutamine amidotransferase